jgi:hypothetical protein
VDSDKNNLFSSLFFYFLHRFQLCTIFTYFFSLFFSVKAAFQITKQIIPQLGRYFFVMRSGIEFLKRNHKNSHQQPLPGSLGKTGRAKAGVNIPLSQ